MAIRKIRVLEDELGKEALRSTAKEVTEVTPRICELIEDTAGRHSQAYRGG